MAGKLETVAVEVKEVGWAWTKIVPVADYAIMQQFEQRYPQLLRLSEAEQTELGGLESEHAGLEELIEAGEA